MTTNTTTKFSAVRHFFHSLIFGRVTFSRPPSFVFDYDRCKWSGWDFYALSLGFFKVTVSAVK